MSPPVRIYKFTRVIFFHGDGRDYFYPMKFRIRFFPLQFFILSLIIISTGLSLFISYLVFRLDSSAELKVPESLALQDGDLVLRRGISIESYAVVLSDNRDSYSHIGIIMVEKGIPFVIHVEPDESGRKDEAVRKEPLNTFLGPGKASHFAIYRSHLDRNKLEQVTSQARKYYLRGYRFDHAYDLLDDRSLYCTELVLKAYRRADQRINRLLYELEDINILVYSHKLLMPGAFTSSNLFYKICSQ